jgi:hypothetical protein
LIKKINLTRKYYTKFSREDQHFYINILYYF